MEKKEEREERGGNGNAADSDEGFYHLSVGPATQTGRSGRPVREGGKARQGKAKCWMRDATGR